jgi:uncharacterized membrane protein YeiB
MLHLPVRQIVQKAGQRHLGLVQHQHVYVGVVVGHGGEERAAGDDEFSQRLAAVGRAAFTNYLGTSLIAAFVFYGWGLGLYGRVSRAEAWLLVPIVWLVMLAWSKPWLDRFQYGPFEWLWRTLARGRVQPMRKRRTAAAATVEA